MEAPNGSRHGRSSGSSRAWTGDVSADTIVLVDSHQVARGAGSGIEVEMDVFWLFEVADGKVRRMHL